MIVVEFEGVRYWKRPEWWVNHPAKVRIDYGDWRPVQSMDGEAIEKWLRARGFRWLNTVGRKHDGSPYREWWGLEGVFPQSIHPASGLAVPYEPHQIRETFQAFRSQVEAAAAA
jgi:hypothetical protein